MKVDSHHLESAFDDGIASVSSAEYEINNAIASVITAAEGVANDYFAIFESVSGRNGNAIGSRLPSVRAKEGVNGKTLEIRWIKSVKGLDGRIRKAYLKGKSHKYNLDKITRGAPEWEKELVVDTEEQFARLRIAYSALMKVKYYLKTAENHIQKNI